MPTPSSDFKTAGTARAMMTGASINAVDPTDPDQMRLRLEILVTYGFLTEEQARALQEAIANGGTTNGLEPLPCPDDLRLPFYDLLRVSIVSKSDSIDFVGEAIALAEGVIWLSDHWDEISGAASDLWDAIFG